MAAYLFQPAPPNLHAHAVATDWPTARGNAQRTGSLRPDDPGPSNPTVLWTFDPSERSGRVMIHSTPTVVDDLLYVGALHQVLTFDSGYVYCVRADTGERIWRFTAGNSLRPVFSSPTVAGGKIYVGEGYHQDQRCRLFSLDAQSGDRIVWRRQARSHVESSPCIVGSRVYFGAGDDGLICVDESQLEEAEGGPPQPRLVWEVPGIHVDVSPLVVDGRVFAGSTVGDKHQVLLAVGVDATSGQTLWQTRSEMRITGSPGYADGRVYFGLGTGKLGQEGDHPHGGVWSLDAASGKEHWLFRTPASVMSTPALMNGHVYFGGTDSHCYCLKQTDGSMVWKQPMPGPVAASAVVAAGKVYVLTTTGTLLCLNAGDGDTLWKLADFAGAEVDDAYASPTLVNGRLYLALGGKVYCVGDR
jgi:outer membrane protein assembly factor BamB